MYIKTFRYHILEKDYPTWFRLSRASNQLLSQYPQVSFRQRPTRKIGGDMVIEECVTYPSKEECLRIDAELGVNPEAVALSEAFLAIVLGEVRLEEQEA